MINALKYLFINSTAVMSLNLYKYSLNKDIQQNVDIIILSNYLLRPSAVSSIKLKETTELIGKIYYEIYK